MLACLVKITTVVEGSDDRETIYLSSANDRRVTTLGGLKWEPAIVEAPAIGMQFWNGDFDQGAQAGQISFTVNLAAAKKSYPDILDAAWTGADVEVMMAPIGSAWPWKTRFKGKVSTYSGNAWPVLSISAEVDVEPFNGNVLTETYAGTGDAEGTADIKEQVKPLALGWPQNVEPILINEVDSVYQFSAYGRIENVVTLYERASAFPPAVGNYATYADLVAADLEPGTWATCLNQGLVRLGAPAYGVITGDLKGHAVSGVAPRAIGDLIEILAGIVGVDPSLISTASLDEMDAEGHTNSDVMVTEQVTFIDAARRLILPMNRQVVISNLGKLVAMKPQISGTPDATLHAQGKARPLVAGNPSEQPTSIPYKTTTMAAERAWRTQTFDEIATEVTLVDRGDYDPDTVYREGNIVTTAGGYRWRYIGQAPFSGVTPGTDPTVWESLEGEATYPDGTPISDLQPDEKGADITSNITGSAELAVQCESNGTPLNGELPKTSNYRLFRGNANVTAASTWTVAVVTGTVSVSIGTSTGILIISSLTTETAQVRITAQFGDKTRNLDIDITKSREKSLDQRVVQLNTDTANALAAAQAAQEAAQAAQDEVQGVVDDITSMQQDIIDNATDITNLTSTVSSQGASISTLQTVASGLQGDVASLQSTVSTQGATISQNSTAITTLQGSVGTLQTTVSTQGASISTLQTASTNQAGQISNLTLRLNAETSPNLLINGSFENGLSNWQSEGSWGFVTDGLWGSYAYAGAVADNTPRVLNQSVNISAGIVLTISADFSIGGGGTGSMYVDAICVDASGNVLLDSSQVFVASGDFDPSGASRQNNKTTFTTPANTARVIARCVANRFTGSMNFNVRQIKLERGSQASAYSAEASITQVYSAINTTTASVATLSTTVSTQGASISTIQQSITTLNGSVATLDQRVTSSGNPNMVRNGSFERGNMGYWLQSGGAWGVNTDPASAWGTFAQSGTNPGNGAFAFITSDYITIEPNSFYTLSADIGHFITGGTGVNYLQIDWYTAADAFIASVSGAARVSGQNFDPTGASRQAQKCAAVAPSNAAKARAIVVWRKDSGTSTSMHVRLIKFERGSVATNYSSEASIAISYQSVQGAFARAAVTLDVNGYMTGWETNNNGQTGNFIIHADYFAILKPGGGAKTEYSNGNWRMYNTAGTLKVEIGSNL